jgi:large subunit ribosomal protein L30
MLRVTLTKSTAKCTKSQKDSVRGLGLRKIRQSRVLEDTPDVRGMILKVKHLVAIEDVESGKTISGSGIGVDHGSVQPQGTAEQETA